MTEGASSGEENANLYMRGVNEGHAGEFLDGEELLAVLDVFGAGWFEELHSGAPGRHRRRYGRLRACASRRATLHTWKLPEGTM